ncbi:hypothetical protein [Shewanella chilikensis]|uniref:hypothetical protein n=1 Tax=Shewanella chilikensis TaxID=558541 RepID=UPI001F317978|nr:hypothetical protein [Shewanella chilikensis]MCE9788436.1 hypothetical protein [Shewanella chilikensis]
MQKNLIWVGIILSVFGWFVDKSENMPKVDRLLASSYYSSLKAFQTSVMHNVYIEKGDVGFKKLLPLIRQSLNKPNKVEVARFMYSTKDTASVVIDGVTQMVSRFDLLIELTDGRQGKVIVGDPTTYLKKEYRDKAIFKFSALFFWTGILLTSFSVYFRLNEQET